MNNDPSITNTKLNKQKLRCPHCEEVGELRMEHENWGVGCIVNRRKFLCENGCHFLVPHGLPMAVSNTRMKKIYIEAQRAEAEEV